jgi:hypothetical protein
MKNVEAGHKLIVRSAADRSDFECRGKSAQTFFLSDVGPRRSCQGSNASEQPIAAVVRHVRMARVEPHRSDELLERE